ncbi:hypothetical protein NITGR_280107 [Nitrospina gracilis 3/211]|uniref:Uncharacterized protein n=1 Tax=Nitrospina gracilis (strain 3/211) TaxID=1266370 RepID=M1YYQ2_NITG3|nr:MULTISPECIES: hypothetical protein [Nitrospina]MCF8723340.1 hypothetical protein [Nitrospina sp. Nb-3]CCQ90391.1 hypothetical protein NITGR_280107 [Nitrospina gracilis 3/211]
MASKKKSKSKKGGGGKLTRSEIVQVRLDPKLKFAAELAARKQRRTLSSFIEWVVDQAIKKEPLSIDPQNHLTIFEAAESVWDLNDAIRFVLLARKLPSLLTYEEELIWKLICETQVYWRYSEYMEDGIRIEDGDLAYMNLDVLKEEFDSFKKVISGDIDENQLHKILMEKQKELEPPF